MRRGPLLILSLAIAALSAIASSWGLLTSGSGPTPTEVATIRNTTVLLYGNGLYRFDTLMFGAGFVAQDLVTMLIGIPMLLASAWLVRRKRITGDVLLYAVLSFFLYVYASMALSAAYNEAFFVYVAAFSASLFAIAMAHLNLRKRLEPLWAGGPPSRVPRRSLAAFMFVAGAGTFFIWTEPLVSALIAGGAPESLGPNTTKVTEALDMAVIVPLTFVSGVLVLRGRIFGYLLSIPLLGLVIMLLPTISLATIAQVRAGISFTPPQIIGPIAGFLLMGAAAALLMGKMVRGLATGSEHN